MSVPRGGPLSAGVSRPLLLVWGYGNSKRKMGHADAGVCYLLDMCADEPSFRKVLSFPGEVSYGLVSSLLGGWGVGREVTRLSNDGTRARILWINPVSGSMGNTIIDGHPGWRASQIGSEVRLKLWPSFLYSVDIEKEVLTEYRILVEGGSFDATECIGFSQIQGIRLVTQLDFESRDAVVWGMPPVSLKDEGLESYIYTQVCAAGPGCADGVYLVTPGWGLGSSSTRVGCKSSVWWRPRGSEWTVVARDVPCYERKSSLPCWLDVAYLGGGRFAIAKAVYLDDESRSKENPEIPLSAVTMLVDGRTGTILEETQPYAASYRSSCRIPEAWWSEKPKTPTGAKKGKSGSSFVIDRQGEVVRYGEGKTAPFPSETYAEESSDGRWLATCRIQKVIEAPNVASVVTIDGVSNTVRSFTITPEQRLFWIGEMQWVDFVASPR